MESSTAGSFQIPPHILDDLCARFVINLPEEESRDPIRIFFQIELAHWFYKDFYCPENPDLRQYGIKDFATKIFQHCPSLSKHIGNFDSILESWKEYKMTVPTYGAILLDPSLEHCLLVQGYWVKASWGFPKGKVNQDESPVDCAIREVFEETGFDITNLVCQDEFIEYKMNEQLSRLYLVPGVSMDTKFKARTRNEIKNFEWFRVDSLPSHKRDAACKQTTGLNPNAFFMVIPFIKKLRQFISRKHNMTTAAVSLVHDGANIESGGSLYGYEIPDATATVLNLSARDSKGRQKQQFAQQMQQEYNEYVGTVERSKRGSEAIAAGCSRLPSSISRSPNKISPLNVQTVKRDDVKQWIPKTEENGANIIGTAFAAATTSTTDDSSSNVFFKPAAWTNFHLDCDAVLLAMFPVQSNTDNQTRRGRPRSVKAT